MKTRVLVIDDDHLVADTLSLIYNANGYECEARYSAADGFDRARDFSPALLLCDVTMPDENGVQLAHRMEENMPDVRVLLLSAYVENSALVAAQSHTMRRPLQMLSKPCRPEDLLRESEALLQIG